MMRRRLLHRIDSCIRSYQSYDDESMWWYKSCDGGGGGASLWSYFDQVIYVRHSEMITFLAALLQCFVHEFYSNRHFYPVRAGVK